MCVSYYGGGRTITRHHGLVEGRLGRLQHVVPLVSARFGYVAALTRIKGEYFRETVVNNVPNSLGLTPGTEREWCTTG